MIRVTIDPKNAFNSNSACKYSLLYRFVMSSVLGKQLRTSNMKPTE